MNIKINTRVEKDLLGHKEIPAHCYYGVQTLRALENFNLSPNKLNQFPVFINALAMVKAACAEANFKLNKLEENKYNAIQYACEQVINYKYHDQFPIDMIQGGAGTSTNMNINEVLANIGLEHLDHLKGEYQYLHPNNDINMSQSTNDVYPTAIKVGLIFAIEQLNSPFQNLIQSFKNKSDEFSHILKMGRTQLQDAVPMTLGQEFAAFASMIAADEKRLRESASLLCEINMGGTAIGTGINAPVGYADVVTAKLAEFSGVPVVKAEDMIAATADTGVFADISGILKRIAVKLSKISNDLRLLSSGPQAGVGDIKLPARQAGSSIMPGKVNPVIPEVVSIACFEAIGNDAAITMAVEAGQLQLNAFEPLMAWALHKSLRHLAAACRTLQINCVEGIEANTVLLDARINESVTLVTALNPLIGYEKAAKIAKAAIATGKPIAEVAEDLGIMSREKMQALLVVDTLTAPGALRAS